VKRIKETLQTGLIIRRARAMTIFPYQKEMMNLVDCHCDVCSQIKRIIPILNEMPIADYYKCLVLVCEWLKQRVQDNRCAKIALLLIEQSRIKILMELGSDENISRN